MPVLSKASLLIVGYRVRSFLHQQLDGSSESHRDSRGLDSLAGTIPLTWGEEGAGGVQQVPRDLPTFSGCWKDAQRSGQKLKLSNNSIERECSLHAGAAQRPRKSHQADRYQQRRKTN